MGLEIRGLGFDLGIPSFRSGVSEKSIIGFRCRAEPLNDLRPPSTWLERDCAECGISERFKTAGPKAQHSAPHLGFCIPEPAKQVNQETEANERQLGRLRKALGTGLGFGCALRVFLGSELWCSGFSGRVGKFQVRNSGSNSSRSSLVCGVCSKWRCRISREEGKNHIRMYIYKHIHVTIFLAGQLA